MSNIQTGAERMPHDLSHLGFLAGQIGRLITISITPVIAGDSFELDAVGALRLSPLRRGLAFDSTVAIFPFYVPHRPVYGDQCIKSIQAGVNATPLPTVTTTVYIALPAFLDPAAGGAGAEGLDSTGDPGFCTLWTLCGMPALNVPLMEGANGLPLGVQLVGPRLGDARLLRTARWLVAQVASTRPA